MTSFLLFWRNFKKNRTHATLTANSTFQHCVGVKIQISVTFQIWRHSDIIFAILTSFCNLMVLYTKILKPSIIIAWKWQIHIFNIFWVWKIRISNHFSNSTSLWRNFCHFDVIFNKNRTNATLKANSPF